MNFFDMLMAAARVLCVLCLPGLAWCWVFPSRGRLAASAVVLLAGSLLSLSVALALAEFGGFRNSIFLSGVGAMSLIGALAGCVFSRARFREIVANALPGLAVFGVGLVVLLSPPQRGEWLAGGWDPGVYLNEGVAISRGGALHPNPSSAYAGLVAMDGLEPFTRDLDEVSEAFPGFPVDLSTGAIDFSFYPLTPVFTALAHRCGGFVASARASGIAALMALLMFAAWLAASGLRAGRVWITVAVLCLQPIFLYHAHTPCAEMPELFLLCGIFYCTVRRQESMVFPILSSLTIFAAVVNHASMVFFGSLWLVVLAAVDARRTDRMKVLIEHALAAAAVLGGMLMYQLAWPLSLAKLPHLVPLFVRLAIVASAATLVFDSLCFRERWRGQFARHAGSRARWMVPGLAALLILSVWVFNDIRLAEFRMRVLHVLPFVGWLKFGGFLPNLAHLSAYIGWPVCLFAGAGILLFLLRGKGFGPLALAAVAIFLFVATLIVLREKHTAELYPWATKRFLPFAIPFVAIFAGWVLSGDWLVRRPRWMTGASVIILLGALVLMAPRIREAWRSTEYDGISEPLADIADQVSERDIVVADHFQWGTPLMFVYGRQVLNGERIWAQENPDALPLLERLKQQGFKIWFLASTDEGMDIFGFNPALAVKLKWTSTTIAYREIMHHRTSTDFPMREQTVQFRLYLWE